MGLCINCLSLSCKPEIFIISRDAEYVDFISSRYLKQSTKVSNIRNMPVYVGYYEGIPVGVAGIGFGEVSAAMYVEELIAIFRPMVIYKLDLMYALTSKTNCFILAQVANTTSRINRKKYNNEVFPAAADFFLLDNAYLQAENLMIPYCIGPVISIESASQFTVAEKFSQLGTYAIDTELNQVYTLASRAGVSALGIGFVIDGYFEKVSLKEKYDIWDKLMQFSLKLF